MKRKVQKQTAIVTNVTPDEMEGDADDDHGANEESSPKSSPSSSSRKYSRSFKFKQFVSDVCVKMKLRGLEEINDDHYLHSMASAIKDGLQTIRKDSQLEVDEQSLKPDDYSETDEHIITMDKTNEEAVFRSYAPNVFQSLRSLLNISSQDYHRRLAEEPYLQYKSNSRSGQIFFMTNDKRYFLKTETRKDAKVLLRFLPQYVTHLTNYPHSLLVRIHGLYSIKLPGKKGKFFSVMQSVFPPEENNNRYDIKGCILNRYVKPEKAGSQYVTVLKDVNFGDQKLRLRHQRQWFLRQVDLDVEFLKGFNIMDYSLLVEQHALHVIERDKDGELADLVIRVRKSFRGGKTKAKVDPSMYLQRPSSMTGSNAETQDMEEDVDLPGTVISKEEQSINVDISNRADNIHGPDVQYNTNVKGSQEMSQELGDFELGRVHRDSYKTVTAGEGVLQPDLLQEHNQRLLPNVHNAIHVVDGDKDRYYVGLIDILGQYTWKKRMETMLKSCIAPRTPFSSVNAAKYAKRFKDYVIAHTE